MNFLYSLAVFPAPLDTIMRMMDIVLSGGGVVRSTDSFLCTHCCSGMDTATATRHQDE